MPEKALIEALKSRSHSPYFRWSAEQLESIKKYLMAQGWRHEQHIDADCFSHKRLANYSPIFHYLEALCWEARWQAETLVISG